MPTIAELNKRLHIDKHALDECLQEQPELFYHCAEQLALTISLRDEAKTNLANVEAKVDDQIRTDAREARESDPKNKITEKEVESQKQLNPKVQAAHNKLSELSLEVGKLYALKEAFIQRLEALKALTKLHSDNAYATDITIRGRAADNRTARADDVKRQQNEERRRR
jgi:hypothetical protein